MTKNIAIIGGGIAGLTCGYYLNRKHNIKLFEKENRLGGNAYSIDTSDGNEADIAVAAFGKEGYGDFFALLDELNLKTHLSSNTFMSMHNLDTNEGLYLTPSIKAGLTQGFDMMKMKNLKSLYDLFKGIKEAEKLLDQGKLKGLTLNDCINQISHIKGNSKLFLIFSLCLLSSMSAEEVLSTPAEFFINKLKVHNDVISPKSIFSVVTVEKGTKSYINAMANTFKNKIQLNSTIQTVIRNDDYVIVKMHNGEEEKFDAVIFACNADHALALLESPTEKEQELLGVWKYKEGKILVHRDHSHFPARDLIQAYTYLYTINDNGKIDTSVNGAIRFEPQVSDDCDLISSQHPNFEVREDLIEFETTLRTPMFTFDSTKISQEMPTLNGIKNSYYCGSHFGYGLHNDAIYSAMQIVKLFDIKTPEPKKTNIKESLKDVIKVMGIFK